MRTTLPLFVFSIALAACGGGTPSAVTPTSAQQESHHGGGHHEHGHQHESKFTGPLRDFHDALAPAWHADQGPERATKTCTQAPAMRDKATALQAAPVPEKATEAAWKSEAKELVTATAALSAECDKKGP